MRGKTSLLNAIRWGFYQRAIGRHSQPIPLQEIPNKDAALEDDWTVEVHIVFEANDHVYDLRRRAEKRSLVSVPQRPDDFQIQVFLKKDGMPIQGDLVVSELNLVAPEQVSRFFLFDGELLQEYETLLIEGSEQGRQIKEAIENVLGVPSLIHGRDGLGTLLRSAQKMQQQDLQRVKGVEKLAGSQAEMTAKEDAYKRDLDDLIAKLESVRNERIVLDDVIDAGQSIYNAKIRLDSLVERQKQIEDYRDQKKITRFDLLGQAWRDLIELKISVRRDQLEARRRELIGQIGDKSGIELQIAQFEKLLNTNSCPICRQAFGEEKRSEIGTDLGRLQGELGQFLDSTSALQIVSSQIEALNKIKGANVRERIFQIDTELQSQEVELTRIENEIEKIRDEIYGYDTAEIARKRALRDEKVKEEGRLQQTINDRRKDIDKVKNELAIAQKAIDGLAQAKSRRSTIKASLCSQLESVFSLSIERLRDSLRKTVEARANEAFHQMTTQKAYRGLEINQSYGLSILDELGHKVTVRSAGAEQVVALSLIDGLNRTGRAAGPIVMDTPFGRLDLKHRDNILKYLPTATSQFILLVHSGEIRPETDLGSLSPRIGASYRIKEVGPRQSVIERITQ